MRPVGRSAMSGWMSVCSSLSNMALRAVCFGVLRCRLLVCRGGCGAPRRGTTFAWFGLQFRFALWISVSCWTYTRDERVEPT